MNDLTENRVKLKEDFLENLSLGFRGLRKSLLNRLEGKSTNGVFLAIREIISGENVCETESDLQDNRYESLMRRLTANNTEALKDLVYNSLQLSVSNLLRQMVAETKIIKESDKKIEKLLRKYRHKVGLKSKSKSIIEDELQEQWLAYKRTVFRQKVLLACLDEKLSELKTKTGQKLTRLLLKYTEKTRKLARRFRGGTINSSESESSVSGSNNIANKFGAQIDEENIYPKDGQESSASKKVAKNKRTKKLFRKIVNPGVYKITPWPVGDPQGPGIAPARPINYGMFLVSTGLVQPSPSVHQTSSVNTLTASVSFPKTILVSPAPSVLTIHSLSIDEDARLVYSTAPPTLATETEPVVPLAEMTNVYTQVIKAYQPKDKTELKLKIGQIVKQKRPADQSGMAYGWMKTSRVGLKKYGFFPVSHVVLQAGK